MGLWHVLSGSEWKVFLPCLILATLLARFYRSRPKGKLPPGPNTSLVHSFLFLVQSYMYAFLPLVSTLEFVSCPFYTQYPDL